MKRISGLQSTGQLLRCYQTMWQALTLNTDFIFQNTVNIWQDLVQTLNFVRRDDTNDPET